MTELLRRTPLRVKLVAAVLALVTLALVVIGVASTFALRSYLTDRVDQQLWETVRRTETLGIPAEGVVRIPLLPSDYVLKWVLPQPTPILGYDQRRYTEQDLPPLPGTPAEAREVLGVPPGSVLVSAVYGEPHSAEAADGGTRWRVLVVAYPNGTALAIGQNMSEVDSAVSRLVWIEVVIGAAVLILLATIGVAAVRTSLRPLREIERTAGAIAAGDLTRRVPDPEPGSDQPRTEVGRLARALNAMLSQIETAFAARAASEERMRRFVADASHELRTPLTTIRGFAELYRQGAAGSPQEAGRLVKRIEDEAARMGLLVEDLLLLARLDQERPLEREPVELPVIVSDAVHAARVVDPDRPIELEVRSNGVPLVVRGDDARLRQVVGNLLTNGLTHTPAGTPIAVRLRAERGMAVIEVADQGPGLRPEQAQRVFERFYRLDSARSRPLGGGGGAGEAGQGTGLGLAIVAALVAAHRGTVDLETAPSRGATFRVRLPLDADANTGDVQDGSSPVEE